jgi:hypothetical protein
MHQANIQRNRELLIGHGKHNLITPMFDPQLVIFAIEAGVKLGRKINEVLVDETAQRPLLLPLGDLFGSVTEAEAMRFFTVEHAELIAPNGSCHEIRDDRDKLIAVYRAMRGLEPELTVPLADFNGRRLELVRQLSALDQFDQAFKAKSPVRRIFGTVVEIGVDYFATHPEAMGGNSAARKILSSFVSGLTDTDFAEGAGRQILADLLGATLHCVSDNAALISDDRRLTVMLAGVTGAVAEDVRQAVASGDDVGRQQLFRRIGTSLLRGATAAFAGDIDLFVPNAEASGLIKDTLTQVLEGIKGQEDLFTNDTLELIVRSALRATAENAGLFTDKKVLQELIARTTTVLADRQWDKLFSAATAGAVLHEALEVARENMETLIDPKHPREQLLAEALAAMAGSLSAKLAGGGSIQDLLSRRQVVDLAKSVLQEVARHPEQLLAGSDDDPRKTVLAQVIASVARALGDEPTLFTNGEGFLKLVRATLAVVVNNADQLVDTTSASPATNLLFDLLKQVVSTLAKADDPRHLVNRDVFIAILERVLPLVSANLEPVLGNQPKIVSAALTVALELAQDTLAHRVNGANLPLLVEGLLHEALWSNLKLEDAQAVEAAALAILRAVPTVG